MGRQCTQSHVCRAFFQKPPDELIGIHGPNFTLTHDGKVIDTSTTEYRQMICNKEMILQASKLKKQGLFLHLQDSTTLCPETLGRTSLYQRLLGGLTAHHTCILYWCQILKGNDNTHCYSWKLAQQQGMNPTNMGKGHHYDKLSKDAHTSSIHWNTVNLIITSLNNYLTKHHTWKRT